MTTKDVADWMREEHAKVEELANRLRTKVATIPRSGLEDWLTDLRSQFREVREHLLKHMALEEEGGYLVAVLDRRPTLSGEVERLRHEHAELTRILDDLDGTLQDVTVADRLLLTDCCQRLAHLLGYVADHETRENLMVISVFTHDIGTKD